MVSAWIYVITNKNCKDKKLINNSQQPSNVLNSNRYDDTMKTASNWLNFKVYEYTLIEHSGAGSAY